MGVDWQSQGGAWYRAIEETIYHREGSRTGPIAPRHYHSWRPYDEGREACVLCGLIRSQERETVEAGE